jgi:hypothetical protein
MASTSANLATGIPNDLIIVGERPYKEYTKWRVVFELLLQCENFHLFKKKSFNEFHKPFFSIAFWRYFANKKKADPD